MAYHVGCTLGDLFVLQLTAYRFSGISRSSINLMFRRILFSAVHKPMYYSYLFLADFSIRVSEL